MPGVSEGVVAERKVGLESEGEEEFTRPLSVAYRAKSRDETVPSTIPRRKEVSKRKISRIPANVMALSSSSVQEIRRRLNSGEIIAVKKPERQKQTTPTETLEYLILA